MFRPALTALLLTVGSLAAADEPLWLLAGGPDAAARAREAGAEPLGRWQGEYLFDLSALSGSEQGRLRAELGLRPLSAAARRAPGLEAALGDPQEVALRLVAIPGIDADGLAARVRRVAPELSVDRLHPHSRRAQVVVSGRGPRLATALDRLDRLGVLLWAEPDRTAVPLNSDSVEPLQANCGPTQDQSCSTSLPLTLTPIWDRFLTGAGEIVGVADTGLDRNEDWFTAWDDGSGVHEAITDAESTEPPAIGSLNLERKVVGYWVMPGASAYDEVVPGHGTHVTGTVLGDRGVTASPVLPAHDLGDGMAPNARVLFQDIGIGNQLTGQQGEPLWRQAHAAGVRVHSNSYGAPPSDVVINAFGSCSRSGSVPDSYSIGDAEVDDMVRRHPDLLVVFAAGNCGDAQMIFHPAAAKNVLTVGALNHGASLTRAAFSSQGPASDGRIKPDLVAPGNNIVSAANDANNVTVDGVGLQTYSGTSMSTPAVAGIAALARQYLREGFHPGGQANPADALAPSAALLKALLINGAENAAFSDTPSPGTGWGRPWLDNSLYFDGDLRGLWIRDVPAHAGLATGEVHSFEIDVDGPTVTPDADRELRVTLVWTDPPALGGDPALVNDLDLEVESTSSGLLRGNVFAGGESAPGGSADGLNNVEGVILRAPASERYTVRVRGAGVPGDGEFGSDRQGYAMVVTATPSCAPPDSAPLLDTLGSDASGNHLQLAGAVAGAEGYRIERAAGDCSVSPSAFQWLAETAATSHDDLATQGGFEYAYRVRALNACGLGPAGNCLSAVSAAPCTLPVAFDTGSVDLAGGGEVCAASLNWAAAESACPAAVGVTYEVLRSTDPGFDPNLTPPVASGLLAPGFDDLDPVPDLSNFYRVRARDDLGNVSSLSPVIGYAAVADALQPGQTFVDPLEDGNPGTRSLLAVSVLEAPWSISEARDADDTFSYRSGPDGQDYPNASCASLTTPEIQLGSNPALTYQALYQLEAEFDGVVVEISADNGQTWQHLPPAGGYPNGGSFAQTGSQPINACGYPASQGAFTGNSPGFSMNAFDAFGNDLMAWAGQRIRLRWRFSSDPLVTGEGFHLDQVTVTDASRPAACLAGELVFRDGFDG